MQSAMTDWTARFRALADETRLDLLSALSSEELSVGELADAVQASQPSVSRHLMALRDAGLVLARKQGAATYYRVRPGDALLEGPVGTDLRRRAAERGIPARVERAVARRRSRTEAFFDDQADTWDALRAELFAETAALASLVALVPRGLRVADIGTGTGGMLPYLAEFAGEILAVDISAEMLRRARARARALGLENVELIKGDLEELPIETASVDAAFAALSLHHAPNPARAIEEMARILQPGGTLVVIDLCAHGHEWLREEHGDIWMGFAREEITAHLAHAGLEHRRFRVVSRAEPAGRGPGTPLELFVASAHAPGAARTTKRKAGRAPTE
jgi:ArsR family transcriptional regulator